MSDEEKAEERLKERLRELERGWAEEEVDVDDLFAGAWAGTVLQG